ncbi:MAG TPA: hypothetical protein VGJ03_02980 [Acidimicrobiales bacterium]
MDEDDFAAALLDFIDRVGPLALVDIRPEDYFGDRQQSALRKVGASLRPLAANELGPVAALAAAQAELIANSLPVATVAKRLGVDSSRVRQRIYARSLYAFKHQGPWLVPSFQLRGRKLLPGLDAALRALSPTLHPVAVSRWFTTPNADLEIADNAVSPVDWLESGSAPEQVAELASAVDQL